MYHQYLIIKLFKKSGTWKLAIKNYQKICFYFDFDEWEISGSVKDVITSFMLDNMNMKTNFFMLSLGALLINILH